MKAGYKRVPVLIILSVLLCLPGISVSGDRPGIDVVLVMDSSGSMKKTDPLSLRIPAAKLFISLLDRSDRAGIISFSDDAVQLSPLLQLDSDANKGALTAAAEKITSSGLHTNLFQALNKGLEVLTGGDNSERERIIVFMTDGMMDVGDAEADRGLVEKLKTDLAGRLAEGGVKVYAIAFTEGSDRQLLERISKQTGGFFNLAMTDKDFHVVFTSIFESLKSPDMLPVTDNGFLIDKSVEEVTIIATKEAPDTIIQLTTPAKDKYSLKNKPPDIEWLASNNFDMMTIKKPQEGKWEILFSAGKNNKAYIITNLNLLTNFNELYPLFGETLDINVWLEKEGGPLTAKEILEKVEVYYELTSPDGETIRLQPFDKGEGVFTRKIELYTAGSYKLRLVADGKTFQREKTFSFKVGDAKESRKDIKRRKSLEKSDEPADHKPDEQGGNETFSWGKVLTRFVIINLILGAVVFGYLKKDFIKGLVKSRFKGKGKSG